MPSGYQVGASCYPTALAAAQAYASAIPPQVVTVSSTCQFWSSHLAAGSVDAPTLYVTYTKIPSSNCPVVPLATVPYVAVPCSIDSSPFHLSVEEGALIAGAVAAVWVSAWCFKALARALNTDGTLEKEIP